jgi:hypothetical protein
MGGQVEHEKTVERQRGHGVLRVEAFAVMLQHVLCVVIPAKARAMSADLLEAVELERVADWRIKKLGENPGDAESARAAELLQRLADELCAMAGSPAYKEYQAICGWLDEFDGMVELNDYAHDYRMRIGVDQFPENGEDYLRVLIGFAKDTFG